MRTATYCLFLLLFFSCEGYSQQSFMGKVRQKGSMELLMSVTVQNRTREKFNESDIGGNFRIAAEQGDTVVFTSSGFKPDTIIVSAFMLTEGFDVYLQPNVVALPSVRVGTLSNYQMDSLERWKDYDWIAPKQKFKLMDKERQGQGDGVGINLNPRYQTDEDKQKARLKKRLDQEERDFYIDFRFSRDYVARLTRFPADSLDMFMKIYRPTYSFCRDATSVDMLLYVNDSMKKFKKED